MSRQDWRKVILTIRVMEDQLSYPDDYSSCLGTYKTALYWLRPLVHLAQCCLHCLAATLHGFKRVQEAHKAGGHTVQENAHLQTRGLQFSQRGCNQGEQDWRQGLKRPPSTFSLVGASCSLHSAATPDLTAVPGRLFCKMRTGLSD